MTVDKGDELSLCSLLTHSTKLRHRMLNWHSTFNTSIKLQ